MPVTNATGILLGTVDPAASVLPGETSVDQVMVPAPATIRPELRLREAVSQLRADGLEQALVTAVDGTLLGRVVTDDLHV